MEKEKAAGIALEFFIKDEALQELHVTADGQVFENPGNAIAHANTLEGKDSPVTIVRGNAGAKEKEPEEPIAEKKGKKGK